jgi:flagellar motor switch protein FliM
MSEPEYVAYDFRKAGGADDSASAFRTWISKASQTFSDNWSEIANSEVSLTTNDFRTQSLEAAVKDVPVDNVCCVFNIVDEQSQSIWHVSQEDAHRLVAELLGVPTSAEIDERALTELELVLARTFFDTLALSVKQGWLGTEQLTFEINSLLVNPKRVRLCRNKDLVITSSLLVPLSRGEVTINWISKKQQMSVLLEEVTDRRKPLGPKSSPEAVVEQLPIEIIGLLGHANMSMRRLANIAVGDIVHLDQKIDQPIVASIDGRPFFKCWPGKVGETIGLEISNCLSSTSIDN